MTTVPAAGVPTATLDRGAVAYRYAGPPGAPPVVLLHALTSSGRTWDRVLAGLADRYRVYAPDQRGHGDSAHRDRYTFRLLADDVARFADALSLDRFTLVGHSMGGTAAYLYAQSHPGRLAALVVEDTAPPPPGLEVRIPPRPDGELDYDWAAMEQIMAEFTAPDPAWWAGLTRITAPTLIIAGGATSHVPAGMLADVAQRIPHCRVVTLDGAGHHVHTADPDGFLRELRAFLDRNQPAAGR